MPLLDPFAEMLGVAPGYPSVLVALLAGDPESFPLVIAKAFNRSLLVA